MTMKPNGNGNIPAGATTTFGFTIMVTNSNFNAPITTCRTP
jgi:endo-1,4-beta-xylanase